MSETVAVFHAPQPRIRRVPVDRPWIWLAAGWRDLWAAPATSLAYGAGGGPRRAGWPSPCCCGLDLPYLVLPLSAGFFFVGPFMAVGLYEISRRLEAGLPVDGRVDLARLAPQSRPDRPDGRAAAAACTSPGCAPRSCCSRCSSGATVPSWDRFMDLAWHSARSLPFLAVGVALGAVLAGVAFAIGAFSMPYLLDRRERQPVRGDRHLGHRRAPQYPADDAVGRPDRGPGGARHGAGPARPRRRAAGRRPRELARLPRHRALRPRRPIRSHDAVGRRRRWLASASSSTALASSRGVAIHRVTPRSRRRTMSPTQPTAIKAGTVPRAKAAMADRAAQRPTPFLRQRPARRRAGRTAGGRARVPVHSARPVRARPTAAR